MIIDYVRTSGTSKDGQGDGISYSEGPPLYDRAESSQTYTQTYTHVYMHTYVDIIYANIQYIRTYIYAMFMHTYRLRAYTRSLHDRGLIDMTS